MLTGAAQASELQAVRGRSIDLGELAGVAYYTPESDGFRVVATLAQGESGAPVRFEAVLLRGQSVVLSTIRAVDAPPGRDQSQPGRRQGSHPRRLRTELGRGGRPRPARDELTDARLRGGFEQPG